MTKRISDLSVRYADAVRAAEALELELAQALLDAYRSGLTWAEVAAAAGLSNGGQARARAEKAMASEELPPSRPRSRARKGEATAGSISVAEAARKLGVARGTVYKMIDRGELTSEIDPLGRTRVRLDE